MTSRTIWLTHIHTSASRKALHEGLFMTFTEHSQRAPFQEAMRRLAATVTVISTGGEGRCYGMTATAVTSISMDPPSLLVCVNRSASFHAQLCRADDFCVNILGTEQTDLSDLFAGKRSIEERCAYQSWRFDSGKIPFLSDAQANIFCKKQQSLDFGSHSIFIGIVNSVICSNKIEPLLYLNGAHSDCLPLKSVDFPGSPPVRNFA